MQHRRRGPIAVVAALLTVAVLVLGMVASRSDAHSRPAGAMKPLPAGTDVVTWASILQAPGDEHPQLCLALMESYPPQCKGLDIVGDVPWAELGVEESQGVRWTDSVWLVGRVDVEAGTLTLTRPASRTRPDDAPAPREPQAWEGPRRPGAPSQATLDAAADAVQDHLMSADRPPVVLAAAGAPDGTLRLTTWYADAATLERIHAVTDALVPRDFIVVESALWPLE